MYLYGPIGNDWFGDGITAKQFADGLKSLGNVSTIDVRIDSEGGLISDARAIYTQLTQHKATINTYIDGIAASAASWIAMAGEKIYMAEGGWLMIHEAQGGARGTWEEIAKASEILRGLNESIVKTYADRTKNSVEKVRSWMTAETWMDGVTALERGFATHLMENKRAVASLSVEGSKCYHNAPSSLQPRRAYATELLKRARALTSQKVF